MKKVALIIGGLVVVALAVTAYLVIWPMIAPKPFPSPAKIMPPGAYAYLAVDDVEGALSKVEASQWFKSIAGQLAADPETDKLLTKFGQELKKRAPLLADRAMLMSLIGKHLTVAFYPRPKADQINVLVASRVGTRALFMKFIADVSARFQKAPALTYSRFLDKRIGQFFTDAGPIYFHVTDNDVGFISNRKALIRGVISRSLGRDNTSLIEDKNYKYLIGRAVKNRRLGIFLRMDHPVLAKLARRLYLAFYGLAPGLELPPKDAKLPPRQKMILQSVKRNLDFMASVKRVILTSDLLKSRCRIELKPGKNALRDYYQGMVDPNAKITHLDMIPKTPLVYIAYAGLKLGNYVKELAAEPATAPILLKATQWLGFKAPGELAKRLSGEFALAVFEVTQSGLLPLPQVMVIVKARDAAAAEDLVARLLRGVDKLKKKPFTGFKTKKLAKGRVLYVSSLVGHIGLAVTGPYIVFSNNLKMLEAAVNRSRLGPDSPAWAIIKKSPRRLGLFLLSPKGLFDQVPKVISALKAANPGRRSKTEIVNRTILPLVELASVLRSMAAWTWWDGKDALIWGGRVFLVDRPIKRRLPVELLRQGLKNLLKRSNRPARPRPPKPMVRRQAI